MFFLAENYRHPAFREGVKDFSGLALGIAAWGLMTGVTMMKSGMSLTESVLMGILCLQAARNWLRFRCWWPMRRCGLCWPPAFA